MRGILQYVENVHFICPELLITMAPEALAQLSFPGPDLGSDPVFMSLPRANAFIASTTRIMQEANLRDARATQTHAEELAHQRQLELAAAVRAQSASPPPAPVAIVPADAEPRVAAFKDGLAALTHLPGTIGFGHAGKDGNTLRHNALVSSDFASKYRNYVRNRATILEKLSPEQRSFAAGAPIDISTLPPWAQIAIRDRFEVDFADLRANYMQAYMFHRVQLVFSFDSVAASLKKGHCIGLAFEPKDKRARE